jgi:hypothetical protein
MSLGGVPDDGGRHRRITALDELDDPPFQGGPFDEDVTTAALAAQSDVRPEAVDQPAVASARMDATKTHDIAEQQGQDASDRHAGQGIRGAADR